jgi:hypothetical protein
MPSRQTVPLILDSCVTAPTASASLCLVSLHVRLRRTKERRVVRLRLRSRCLVASLYMYGWSFEECKRDFSATSVLGKSQVGCW